jgi:hypothetical protein
MSAALLGGCAHSNRPSRQVNAGDDVDAPAAQAVYRERASRPAASALVFSPPVSQDLPALELSRDERQPSAFVGYPEGVAEFFYVRWDDRQVGGGSHGHQHGGSGGSGYHDRYERRAVSEKVGVLYR